MRITVAICTWNRADMLRQTLSRMCELVSPSDAAWELLVVDNNCTDATADVIRSFSDRLPLRVIEEHTPGVSHARNRVLQEASGDFILWTDDDVLVDRDWLASFVQAIHRYPDAAAYGGPIEPWFLEAPDAELCAAFPVLVDGFCALDHRRDAGPLSDRDDLWGANMAIRRDAVQGLRFNTAFGPTPTSPAGGDEVDFLRQIRSRGGVIVWCPEMRVKHCVTPSRATLAYLSEFTISKGREQAGLSFDNRDRTARLFLGSPLWLWRESTAAAAGYWASRAGLPVTPRKRLRSGPFPEHASKSVRTLIWLRERLFLTGISRAYSPDSTRNAGFHHDTGLNKRDRLCTTIE
jgi:glucosyl-dolichyl phosphate glucuronosyltransferase